MTDVLVSSRFHDGNGSVCRDCLYTEDTQVIEACARREPESLHLESVCMYYVAAGLSTSAQDTCVF